MNIEALAKQAGFTVANGSYGLKFSGGDFEMFARLVAEAERHDCEIAVWLVRQEATKPDAPDEGVNGWLKEAEDRIRMRSNAPLKPTITAHNGGNEL